MEKWQTRGAQNAVLARACGFDSRLRHQPSPAPVNALSSPSSHSLTDRHQANQEQRIDQRIRSRELNRREAARLDRGQERVNRMEDRALADGKIGKGEFRRIENAQNAQSQRIYRQKHDRQAR